MNRYPLWMYALIAAVMAVGLVWSLPNLYPEDAAVQISNTMDDRVDDIVRRDIERVLAAEGLGYKSVEEEGGRLLVRLLDTEDQLKAADILRGTLDSRHVVALNLAPATPDWLRAINAKPMALGLDLRGGVHFLMQVDMNAVMQQMDERYVEEFRAFLRDEKVRYQSIERGAGGGVSIHFTDSGERDRALTKLDSEYSVSLQFEDRGEGEQILIAARLTDAARTEMRRNAVQQNIVTLRNRVNELGVAEPVIQQQGEDRIVVQLPGVQDTARAKEILGATATLEFRLVDEQGDPFDAAAGGRTPAGSRLYRERDGTPVLLQRRVIVTGENIIDAQSGIDSQTGTPNVSITLDGPGARSMGRMTAENVGRMQAVVFIETKTERVTEGGQETTRTSRSEDVINVARIREPFSKRFQITGLESSREARNLSLLMRAGALAAPMMIVEERTIGPSLGRDNIDSGMKSVMIGFLLVLVFMAVYYRVFGLIANLALAMNLVLIVAVLSMLQATLTMPGIAGIVLTVGMAVDANVLIFERIREELRIGNSPQAAIQSGYGRAFSTIMDANITTLIAAVVLFTFGTGPIKGFAITLTIGIAMSMFTAIVGTRALVNLLYGGRRLKTLPV